MASLPRGQSPEMYEKVRKDALGLQKIAGVVRQPLAGSFKAAVGARKHCSYMASPHQAGLQLARLLKDKKVDLVVYSPDGDVLVHGVSFLPRKIELGGHALLGLLVPLTWAGEPDNSPKVNLFEVEDTPEFRVTVACILGSDYCPAGVEGVGAKKLVAALAMDSILREADSLLE